MSNARARGDAYRRAIADRLSAAAGIDARPWNGYDPGPRLGSGHIEGLPGWTVRTYAGNAVNAVRDFRWQTEAARIADRRPWGASIMPLGTHADPADSVVIVTLNTLGSLLRDAR